MDLNTINFEITPSSTSVDEGSVAFFNITARSSGPMPSLLNNLPYEISGVSAEDISMYKQGDLGGTFHLSPLTATATIAIRIVNDFTEEGPEVLTVYFKERNTVSFMGNVSFKEASASITINDTSNSPLPKYSIRFLDSGSITEGSSANFLLTTTGLSDGALVSYSLSGINLADISDDLQSPNLKVNSSGEAFIRTAKVNLSGEALITIPILADKLTEGNEVLTVTSMGASATVTIYDTSNSKGPASADLVYVFKSEKTGPAINPASYSYYYTTKPEEAAYINAQASWPWVQKASTFEAAHSNPELSTPVYRFWSDKLQAPYFTINTDERDQIIAWSSIGKNGYDWQYFPGTGFNVYTSSTPTDDFGKSAIPVYCAWMDDTDFNPVNGLAGGLLFTADKSEYDGLIKLVGVTGAGIVFYGEVPGN